MLTLILRYKLYHTSIFILLKTSKNVIKIFLISYLHSLHIDLIPGRYLYTYAGQIPSIVNNIVIELILI